MARLVKPNEQEVEKRCKAKGWGAMELAAAAGIAVATAAKIMRGEPCFRKSLLMVAEAFDTHYVYLVETSPAEKTEEKKYEWHFHFAINVNEFDEEKILRFMEKLKKEIGGNGDIDVTKLDDDKSSLLGLSLTEADTLRLIAAIKDNREGILASLGVQGIWLTRRSYAGLETMPIKAIIATDFLEVPKIQRDKIAASEPEEESQDSPEEE